MHLFKQNLRIFSSLGQVIIFPLEPLIFFQKRGVVWELCVKGFPLQGGVGIQSRLLFQTSNLKVGAVKLQTKGFGLFFHLQWWKF